MAAKYTITEIDLGEVPGVNQVVTIMYRLESEPDSPGSYTTVTTTQVVNSAGVLVPQLVIPGLTLGTNYVARAINNCNATYKVDKSFTTPLPSCVTLTEIIGTASEE